MISSQLRHCVEEFDEIIHQDAIDFSAAGLKTASVVRLKTNISGSVLLRYQDDVQVRPNAVN
jgi:hypothetical protein